MHRGSTWLEVRGQLWEAGSLLSPCGSPDGTLGIRPSWGQALLSTELSQRPGTSVNPCLMLSSQWLIRGHPTVAAGGAGVRVLRILPSAVSPGSSLHSGVFPLHCANSDSLTVSVQSDPEPPP